MHNPYDVMTKGLLEGTLTEPCEVCAKAEIVTDAKAIDTLAVLDPTRLHELDGRGLIDLPRMGLAEYTAKEETMGYYLEGLKLLEERDRQVRNEALAPLFHQSERKLKRALTDTERTAMLARLVTLGAMRLGDVVLDLDGPQLAAWLADPLAK